MKKILYFMSNLFYNSFLGGLYLEFLLWLNRKKITTEKKYIVPKNRISLSAVQVAYTEGINAIKNNINDRIKDKTKEEQERIIAEIDLLNLTIGKLEEESKAMRFAWVYKEKDIKSKKDEALMIEKRINDYKELHEHKLNREKLRSMRKK